jgi:hypothetical protein
MVSGVLLGRGEDVALPRQAPNVTVWRVPSLRSLGSPTTERFRFHGYIWLLRVKTEASQTIGQCVGDFFISSRVCQCRLPD